MALRPRGPEPARDRDAVPVRTDRHAVDASVDPEGGLPPPAGRHIPEVDERLAGLGGDAPVDGCTRPCHDSAPVRAEGNGVDAPADIEVEALEVAEPLDVVPLPAAPIGRAAVQQFLGQRGVVSFHLAIGPVDAADIVLAGE
jgi:hypothetical protein